MSTLCVPKQKIIEALSKFLAGLIVGKSGASFWVGAASFYRVWGQRVHSSRKMLVGAIFYMCNIKIHSFQSMEPMLLVVAHLEYLVCVVWLWARCVAFADVPCRTSCLAQVCLASVAPSDRASFGDPVPTELYSAKGRGWGKIYELSNIGASFWVGAPSFFIPSASFWSKWSVSHKPTCP